MKKNGFTLVELLAVILIIGLIFLLAVTNVIPIFRKSKTKGFINDAVTLAEAARIKYKDDILNNIDDDLFAGNISGKKCYSIKDHLMGEYASDLNSRLEGSVEVCFGTTCDYKTKLWMTNGSMYIDGDVIDENIKVENLIKDEAVSTYYSTCGVNLPQQNIAYEFTATKSIKSLTIPETGVYKLEVWGAQGGSTHSNDSYTSSGGYGAYSVGEIELQSGQTLYIVVGGKGLDTSASGTALQPAGGYNGGAKGNMAANSNRSSGSGGGATHIALESGLLSTFSAKTDKLLIVAGGGGGGFTDTDRAGLNSNGGHGGGFEGTNFSQILDSCSNNCTIYDKPSGGTQTNGGIGITNWSLGTESTTQYVGTFGQGATGTNSYGGGGGGFYGGASGNYVAGAGGSGYIGNTNLTNKAMYCFNCHEALNLPIDEGIFTISTTGLSKYKNTGGCPNGYSSKPVSKCAKAGDGFARITKVPT